MLNVKNNKLLVVFLVFLVLAFFINKESTVHDKMRDSFANHEHENALIFASRLLEVEANNQEAISIIKKSAQILSYLQLAKFKLPSFNIVQNRKGQLFFYSHDTTGTLISKADSGNFNNQAAINTAKVYEYFNMARAYTAKAKTLDSKFKTTLNFEQKLDEAQRYLLAIMVENTLESGSSIYSTIFKEHQKKLAIVNSAANSDYLNILLDIQSAWTPGELSASEIRENINSLLETMDNTGHMVSKFKIGNLADSLFDYVQVIRRLVDIISTPKGSYKEFVQVANNSTNEYEQVRNKLKRAVREAKKVNDFSTLMQEIAGYKLFYNDATTDLITKNNKYIRNI